MMSSTFSRPIERRMSSGGSPAIRADAKLAHLPVHVITADVELQGNYAEKGFDGIILKPVTVGTLGPLLAGLEERKD